MSSKLEQLLQQLCPQGVEYRRIGDVYTRLKGTSITAATMKTIACEEGEIRVFAGGRTAINAHASDIPHAKITRVPAVLVQSRGVIDFIYYDKPFTFKNEMWAYTHSRTTFVKYLMYVLKNNLPYFRKEAERMGSMPQISTGITENYLIPFPPLDIQKEIVRVLDQFTELTEALTAALTVRQKQYAYYRDLLLQFHPPFGGEVLTLSELCDIKTGKLNANAAEENGKYPFFTCGAAPGRINQYAFDTEAVLLAGNGYIGTVHYYKGKFNAYQRTYVLSNFKNVLPKYVKYYLDAHFLHHISAKANKASVPYITLPMLQTFSVVIPPYAEQKRIVGMLDCFDTLCNDLTSGLPAEIEARRKQYEYYRDKLLTFQPLKQA